MMMRAGYIARVEVMRAVAVTARKMPPEQIGAADATALKKLAKQAGEAAQLLKLLGNEKRLLILCFLAVRGEMTVGELVDVVKLSQSALSQHLARMRDENIVTFRRDSQTLWYRIKDPRIEQLMAELHRLFCRGNPSI